MSIETVDRDARGQFAKGNQVRTVTGARSVVFWQASDAVKREVAVASLQARGYASFEDAPVTLQQAALGFAEAVLVRDSAFARMVEHGGPLTTADRERGAHRIWSQASDRVLRYAQAIGFTRAEPRVPTAAELLRGDQ